MKRERMLGLVQLALLHLIDEGTHCESYGEALAAELVPLFGETISPPQVHTALRRLEERGLIVGRDVRLPGCRGVPRKMYNMMPVGAEALD